MMTVAFHLKSCPRCRGDIQECADKDGKFLRCIQCGYHKDLNADRPFTRKRDGPRKAFGQFSDNYTGGNDGPSLPEKPTNFLPWRERERKAWEREAEEPLE